jgi:hypothetical protein
VNSKVEHMIMSEKEEEISSETDKINEKDDSEN